MPGLHEKFVYNRAIVLSCFSFSVNKLKRKIYYLAKNKPKQHSFIVVSINCKHCRYLLAFHCCFAYYHNIIIIVLVVTIAIIIILTITTKLKIITKMITTIK